MIQTFPRLTCNPFVSRRQHPPLDWPCYSQENLIWVNIKSDRYLTKMEITMRLIWIINRVAHPFWFNNNSPFSINRLFNFPQWCKRWVWMPIMVWLVKPSHWISKYRIARASNNLMSVKQYHFRPTNLKNKRLMTSFRTTWLAKMILCSNRLSCHRRKMSRRMLITNLPCYNNCEIADTPKRRYLKTKCSFFVWIYVTHAIRHISFYNHAKILIPSDTYIPNYNFYINRINQYIIYYSLLSIKS